MYSTCLFCHARLGTNEALESFPVGRRLAYDVARGRLWVVCHRCGRWNLSPLEERWEAVEECERLFKGTRLRVSTENIGLARNSDASELVRVGRAQRPELAAWRYGRQFGRRHRRAIAQSAAVIAISIPALWTGAYSALVAAIPGGALLVQVSVYAQLYWANRGIVARLTSHDSDDHLVIRGKHLRSARLVRNDESQPNWSLYTHHDEGSTIIGDAEGSWLAGKILARINRQGGRERVVQRAVARLEHAGSSQALFNHIAGAPTFEASWYSREGDALTDDQPVTLWSLPIADRLALEMASHEEAERRALEGELRELEAAWREAEEIAAIADSLTLPAHFDEFLARHRNARDATRQA